MQVELTQFEVLDHGLVLFPDLGCTVFFLDIYLA